MLDLLLVNSDLDISTGDLAIVSGTEEVAQAYTIKLRTRLLECPFDLTAGIDYEKLFSAQTSMEYKKLMLRKALYEIYGVKTINSFELLMDKANFTLYVDCNVTTTYSDTAIIKVQL
jgi:hypothetical protein